MDVRHHPAVCHLTRHHLQAAQGSSSGLNVILSPYGLSGTLTGQSYKDSDPNTQRLLDEWRQFYPLQERSSDDLLPSSVEVIVGGLRLRYPSNYVLIVELDDVLAGVCNQGYSGANGGLAGSSSLMLTPPTSPCDTLTAAGGFLHPSRGPFLHTRNPSGPPGNPLLLPGKAHLLQQAQHEELYREFQWQPSCLPSVSLAVKNGCWQASTIPHPVSTLNAGSEQGSEEDPLERWDFQDPICKATCSCSRCKSKARPASTNTKGNTNATQNSTTSNSSCEKSNTASANSSATGTLSTGTGVKKLEKADKNPTSQRSRVTPAVPFHRRSPVLIDPCSVLSNDHYQHPAVQAQEPGMQPVHQDGTQQQQQTTQAQSSSNTFQPPSYKGTLPSLRAPTPSASLPLLQSDSPHPSTPLMMDVNSSSASTVSTTLTTTVLTGSAATGTTSSGTASGINPPTTDPAMPTLSPHPPQSIQEDEVKMESQETLLATTGGTPSGTVAQSPLSITDPMSNSSSSIKTEKPSADQPLSPYQTPGSNHAMLECKGDSSWPPSVSTPVEEGAPNFPPTPNNSNSAIGSIPAAHAGTSGPAPNLSTAIAAGSTTPVSTSSTGISSSATTSAPCLKRPMLPVHTSEDTKEEDLRNGLLYDYSCLATPPWDCGVTSKKRQRTNFGRHMRSSDASCPNGNSGSNSLGPRLDGGPVGVPGVEWTAEMLANKPKDPYEFNDEFDEDGPSSVASSSSAAPSIFRNRVDSTQIKEEDKNKELLPSTPELQTTAGDTGANPDGTGASLSVTGSGSDSGCSATKGSGTDGGPSPTPLKADAHSTYNLASPPTPRNQGSSFTQEKDLMVSEKDLDQIFDTSSDDSSDDMFQAPSTPSSITAKVSTPEETPVGKNTKSSTTNTGTVGILGAAELTRMFPTPPSLEHTVAQSPSGPLGATETTLLDTGDIPRDKMDLFPNYGSPGHEVDWSYVYKLPIQQKFISSSRYSSLSNLSCSSQPPSVLPSCQYKPSWQQHQTQQNHLHTLQHQQQQHQQHPHQQHQQQQQPSLAHHHPPVGLQHQHQLPVHHHHHHHHHQHPQQQQHHLSQQQQHHHPSVPLSTQQQLVPPHPYHPHHQPPHSGYPGPPQQQHPAMHPLSHHHPMQHPGQPQHHPGVGHPHMQQHLPPHVMHQQQQQQQLAMQQHQMQQQHYPNLQHGQAPMLQHPSPHPHHHPSQMMGGSMLHPHLHPQQQPQQPPPLGHPPLIMDNRHPMNCHPMMGLAPPEHPERMMGMSNSSGSYPMDHHPLDHRGGSDGMPYDLQSPTCIKPLQQAPPSVDSGASGPCVPEAHSLVVNLVLSDSMLNLFKDHNFAGCNVCVCNMNIKGADAGIYLPDFLLTSGSDEPQYKCTCGFSAVVNRHNSYRSGLFYEDELDITGIHYEAPERHHKHIQDHHPSSVVLDRLEGGHHVQMNGSAMGIYNSSEKDFEPIPTVILDLIKQHCSTLYSACSVFYKAFWLQCAELAQESSLSVSHNALVVSDHCELGYMALETGRQSADVIGTVQNSKLDEGLKILCLHKWPYLLAKLPPSNQDTVGLLRTLQPLLQEAVQKKRTGLWEVTYKVSGPLTWRQFHRLAGRGTEDQCEPQPIPTLLVGHDKDWLSISPFALKFWDNLLLEPYPLSRDVAYVVVAPDNEYILGHLRTFFRELSCAYEVSRLGRHCPINKVLRDGILRVGKTAARNLADQPVDEWFNQLGRGPVAAKIKLYAQACRYHLAPHLKEQSLDRSLLDGPPVMKTPENPPAASPMPPSTPEGAPVSTGTTASQPASSAQVPGVKGAENESATENGPDHSTGAGVSSGNCNTGSQAAPQQPTPPHSGGASSQNSNSQGSSQPQQTQPQQQQQQSVENNADQEEEGQGPSLVIYIVEPFSYNSMDSDLYRLATVGLLRCYTQMLRFLPERILNSIHLQIITLDSILNLDKGEDGTGSHQQLKDLAFSVFSQCRRLLAHQSNVKSLTGFGPAAAQDMFLKGKNEKYSSPYRLLSLPFILAPQKDKQTELGEMFGDRREKSGVFLCTYCLTGNQKWLLASCTNDKGEILETCTINIAVPNRTRRKKASARKLGLHKLLEFIVGVLSNSTQPWRLVVGRLGRVGHGELREWASLLSRKSLLRYSRQLREQCMQCSVLSPSETPCILSACLVSLEPDAGLRVMSDQFTPDDRFTSSCHSCDLSTPQDATCTHILVFPTSATTQSSQATFHQEHLDPMATALGDDDIFQALNDDDINVGQDITDIFQWTTESPTQSPSNSPSRRESVSQPGSPGGMGGSGGRQSPFQHGIPNRGSGSIGTDTQEEPLQLLQQPLALGYYVSTATTGPLPKWFWSSCPHLQNSCPAFLKSALLIHSPSVQQSSDDLLHANPHTRNYHALDSNLTTDVLRYVLEAYNALSWLSLDPVTHDRRSCLPVNIQVLMQIYNAFEALT